MPGYANVIFVERGQWPKKGQSINHMRSHGCRDLLIYCEATNRHHRTIMNADHLPAGCVPRLFRTKVNSAIGKLGQCIKREAVSPARPTTPTIPTTRASRPQKLERPRGRISEPNLKVKSGSCPQT